METGMNIIESACLCRNKRSMLNSALIAILCSAGCSSLRPVTDDLDPVPAWYNDGFRSYVSGQYMEIVEEIRLLCWQEVRAVEESRYSREREVHTIYMALVWVRLCSQGNTSWSHAFIWSWTTPDRWGLPLASHSDHPVRTYYRPPTNTDIYEVDTWGRTFDGPYNMKRTIIANGLRARTWEAVIGEKPTRPFPSTESN
jgi:hypothetical protein